jgi:hypothetical protein
MSAIKTLGFTILAGLSANAVSAEFSFDHTGSGVGTGITPVGKLAWEQSIPSASYYEERNENGQKVKVTTLNADVLLRTGLAEGLELQLGWDGPGWSKVKVGKDSKEYDGLGDVSIGIKKAIDLDDDKMSMAVLAQATIATGNDDFTNGDDIYSLGSVVAYQYNDWVTTSISMIYEVQNSDWAVTAVPTVEYQIAGNWSGFSELVYKKAESKDVEYNLGSGLIYTINDRAQVDATVGVDLNGLDKSYQAGLGFSYLF